MMNAVGATYTLEWMSGMMNLLEMKDDEAATTAMGRHPRESGDPQPSEKGP